MDTSSTLQDKVAGCELRNHHIEIQVKALLDYLGRHQYRTRWTHNTWTGLTEAAQYEGLDLGPLDAPKSAGEQVDFWLPF
jgi:hypothetical protein